MSVAAEQILVLHQRRLASTLFANLLEDMEHEGFITRSKKEELYLSYAAEYGLSDLLPRKLPTMVQHPLDLRGETMSKGVIIERKAGKEFPKGFASTAAASYPGSFGYAAMVDGKLDIGQDLLTTDIPTYEEVLGKDDVKYFLSKEPCPKGSEQPFILLKNEQDQPVLIAMIEGDCDDWHDTNGQTDEANFVKSVLMPKIDDITDTLEGDISKIVKYLQKATVVQELLSKLGDRAVISFMANTGDAFSIEANTHRKKFDWGEMSIEESAYPDKKTSVPEVKKEQSTADRLRELREKRGKLPDGVHATNATKTQFVSGSNVERFNKEQQQAKSALKEDVDNATVLKDKRETFLYPPPEACATRNTLQQWCNTGFGTCPQGYQLAVGHPEKAVPMPQSALNPKRAKDPQYQQTSPNVASSSRDDKDTGTHHLATDAVVGAFPVVPAAEKADLQKTFIKTIDMKSTDILDPSTMKEIEVKSSTFFDQMGITFEEFCRWPATEITKFCANPKWLTSVSLCIQSLRYANAVTHLQHKKKVDAAETTHTVAKEETKPETTAEKLKRLRAAKEQKVA